MRTAPLDRRCQHLVGVAEVVRQRREDARRCRQHTGSDVDFARRHWQHGAGDGGVGLEAVLFRHVLRLDEEVRHHRHGGRRIACFNEYDLSVGSRDRQRQSYALLDRTGQVDAESRAVELERHLEVGGRRVLGLERRHEHVLALAASPLADSYSCLSPPRLSLRGRSSVNRPSFE